jgi:hypothetical protein
MVGRLYTAENCYTSTQPAVLPVGAGGSSAHAET